MAFSDASGKPQKLLLNISGALSALFYWSTSRGMASKWFLMASKLNFVGLPFYTHSCRCWFAVSANKKFLNCGILIMKFLAKVIFTNRPNIWFRFAYSGTWQYMARIVHTWLSGSRQSGQERAIRKLLFAAKRDDESHFSFATFFHIIMSQKKTLRTNYFSPLAWSKRWLTKRDPFLCARSGHNDLWTLYIWPECATSCPGEQNDWTSLFRYDIRGETID